MTAALPASRPLPVPTAPCGAKLRQPREDGRTTCEKLVRAGGQCRSHGGNTPNAVKAREQRIAMYQAEMAALARGDLRPVSPEQVLLEQLEGARRRVGALESFVGEQQAAPGLSFVETLQLLQSERQGLSRMATDALKQGIGVSPEQQGWGGVQLQTCLVLVRRVLESLAVPTHRYEVCQVVQAELERARTFDVSVFGQGYGGDADPAPAFDVAYVLPTRDELLSKEHERCSLFWQRGIFEMAAEAQGAKS